MEIRLISYTHIEWGRFVTACDKLLGRSPTRSLDAKGNMVGDYDSFLSTLDEFNRARSSSNRISEFTLNHLSLTFLMVLEEEIYVKLLEQTYRHLFFIRCQDFDQKYKIAIIATGTLKNWKDCITNVRISEWSTTMWQIFHDMGLNRLFNDYKINERSQIERR